MMYKILNKSDFETGATLVVSIPEGDLDKKALYTILAERPEFILPFRHRSIDGNIEFTYQIGRRSKLTYMSGSRPPREYAELWISVLSPLFDCADWFMNPYSFVLKTEYIYCDKNGKQINFVYIPSIRRCTEHDALRDMAAEIAKQNRTTDLNFENKVVWALQDFSPNEFLQMVKSYETVEPSQLSQESERLVQPAPAEARQEQIVSQFAPLPEVPAKPVFWSGKAKSTALAISAQPVVLPVPAVPAAFGGVCGKSNDIFINLPADGKMPKAKKEKTGWFGSRKEPREIEKEAKPDTKEKGGFFKKKRVQGNAQVADTLAQQKQERGYYEEPLPILQETSDVTQLDILETSGAKLRYVGNGEHPRVINVFIAEGGVFTIGRFDSSVKIKQSNFEFDKKTRAVSRRHVAIERGSDGYGIVDLASSAGTFLNGHKLPPNIPVKLEKGCRVSFGNSGADYIWDE